MRRTILWWGMWLLLGPSILRAQSDERPDLRLDGNLEPLSMGFRFDDNVMRSTIASNRLSDGIYALNMGFGGRAQYDLFRAEGSYNFSVDQYQLYSTQNNFGHNLTLGAAFDPGEMSFSYKKGLLWRSSNEPNYDYNDDGDYFEAQWLPAGPWIVDGECRLFDRNYYNSSGLFKSRDFADRSGSLAVQRELSEKISVRVEGGFNSRKFNRTQVKIDPYGVFYTDPSFPTQADDTWSVKLSAHLYIESVLQDIQLERQRTDSNSAGFSNTVESLSWAAVLKPAPNLYLQLFFRLYSKVYDQAPPQSPYYQLGYADEDGQDLLAIKTSWEWSPQWSLDLGISRLRTEATQPDQFYIKDVFSADVQRNF